MNKIAEQRRANKKAYPKGRQVDAESLKKVQELLAGQPKEREFLIENLHILQDHFGRLTADSLVALAQEMKVSQSEVYEVATFYHHFEVIRQEAEGFPEYTVRICN